MNERDVTGRLEALGSAAVPPPSDELMARFDGRRLSSRAPEARRHFRFPVLLPAAAVAALLVGFVLISVHRDGGTAPSVVLENAVDASVSTNGAATPARPGSTIPDGAEINVGPSGSVTVGGVTLGPGERAVVRAGRLQRLRAARQAIAAEWQAAPVSIDLEAHRTSRGVVRLEWNASSRDDVFGYVVYREDRTVVARRRATGLLAAADRDSPEGSRYVVVVLDAQLHPIARSQVATV